ncbi:hypothetical protein NDU88_000193 [Pleurodeles waltl]|uniref:Uncharacterized protein n=1 Tax=Pleurodeles waltl TaxID=8319 RepID=A0AAV7S8X5_PLEWA|nr:hypothetical protein NDU88_000193 [Pleurodeles waltl]
MEGPEEDQEKEEADQKECQGYVEQEESSRIKKTIKLKREEESQRMIKERIDSTEKSSKTTRRIRGQRESQTPEAGQLDSWGDKEDDH